MSLTKLLLTLLVSILMPVTLCFGNSRYLYDHTYTKLAAYPVPNVWLEGDPTNSYVAAMIYTGDGLYPSRNLQSVSVLVTSLGKDGGVDGGDWADVAYWKVFIFDVTAGDRSEMRNHFSVRALAAGGTNVIVAHFRRPTNSTWNSPIGYHPTGQKIYYFTFDVRVLHLKTIYGHVYAMGAVPVLKGGQKDMPFLPLIWLSYGMAPTNSTYLGSGTNRGMYGTPGLPDALSPMLNADGDMPALFLGDPHLPWGNASTFFMGAAVETDSILAWSVDDMATRLVSWSPTNLVLETVVTTNNYGATLSGYYGFVVESTPDLAHPRWLDVAAQTATGSLAIGDRYQLSAPRDPSQGQRFYRFRNGMFGMPCCETGMVLNTIYTMHKIPNPTNYATVTSVRPTNILYTPYTGTGRVAAAAQPLAVEPTVPLTQALASVQYSPAEAQTALAKSSAQSSAKTASGLVVSPATAADTGEVAYDHDGRVVLWRNNSAPTVTAKASLQSVSPEQLRASDPAAFYAPNASAERFISQFGHHFGGANPQSGFRAQIAERDGLGMTHVRYRQNFGGVPVFGAEVVVHVDAAGSVTTANGLAAKDPAVSVVPTEAIEHARESALELWRKQPRSRSAGQVLSADLEVFSPRLFLCDSTPEFSETNVVDATDRPNGPENDAAPAQPTGWVNADYLTWRIRVTGEEGEPDLTYFVDAHNGKPRWVLSNRMGLTNRQIYDLHNGTSASGATLARSEGQGPTGITDVDAAYDCFGNINNFYNTVFGRNGANGMGGLNVADGGLTGYVNYADSFFAAGLGGSQYLPPSTTTNTRIETTHSWIDAKTFAHEYTHGLDYFTHPPSGRTYQNQSGALMESTANILAECFQKHLTGTNDWRITSTNFMHGPPNEYFQGFQVLMSDPWQNGTLYGAYGDPRSLYDRNYYCGSTAVDNGGVHANSYPISFAAYLLARGGSFNNCTINPIGMEAVGAIWYRANGYYSASANFAEAFLDLQQAAADLYPSNVVAEVRKALQAVEMDQPGRCTTSTPRAKPEPASAVCVAPDFNNHAVLGKCNYYGHEFWDFVMPLSHFLIKFGSDGGNPPAPTFKYYIVPEK
ncbi:MAG: M4 family metallopeptidase [Verrucomicrobiota bacterium]